MAFDTRTGVVTQPLAGKVGVSGFMMNSADHSLYPVVSEAEITAVENGDVLARLEIPAGTLVLGVYHKGPTWTGGAGDNMEVDIGLESGTGDEFYDASFSGRLPGDSLPGFGTNQSLLMGFFSQIDPKITAAALGEDHRFMPVRVTEGDALVVTCREVGTRNPKTNIPEWGVLVICSRI